MSDFLAGKRVLVTGGAGLLGSAFIAELLGRGASVRTVRHERAIPFEEVEIVDGDLTRLDDARRSVEGEQWVIHAAAVSGGSMKVQIEGIRMFTDNLLMNTQMLEASRLGEVDGYLFLSNSSVYAKSSEPLREEDAWGETSRGIPENETGMVKRVGETQCTLYTRMTSMKIAVMRGANAYGPHDNFDLEKAHVVPALIRKAVEGNAPFELWGSGRPVRDFIHSRDLARAGLLLLEKAVEGTVMPINIGSGRPISIADVARKILDLAGRAEMGIRFTGSSPPAAEVKLLDLSRMREIGFETGIPLEKGLEETIEWYQRNSDDHHQNAAAS